MRNNEVVLYTAPLLEVAWADGHVSDGERLSILEMAAAQLIDAGGSAYDQLLDRLSRRPSREYFARGLQALQSAFASLSFTDALSMQRDLTASCARIASASRSAIDLRIPDDERRTIDRISAELVRGANDFSF